MTKLHQAAKLGQAIWLDYIHRTLIESGELQQLIADGLRGITSNPAIFEKAITGSADYDEALAQWVEKNKSPQEIYEALAIEDIQRAADLLRNVYDETEGLDGYVSLEASPWLAYDTEGTIREVHYLFVAVDRPNVMIKVPATTAGIPAIATLIGEGININVTLMFSLTDYEFVSDAYLRGLERLAAKGGDLSGVASVASFFVSRVDTAVDEKLDQLIQNGEPRAAVLKGQIGIANSKLAYAHYLNVFSSERWQRLAGRGGRVQRLLWGSTGVKDPAYPDTLYVDNLMGANTVNTVPPSTLKAFRDHGTIASGLTANMDEARAQLSRLAELGLDLEIITQQLQDEGVIKFADAFNALMEGIAEKCHHLQPEYRAG
jgi:transaldolase